MAGAGACAWWLVLFIDWMEFVESVLFPPFAITQRGCYHSVVYVHAHFPAAFSTTVSTTYRPLAWLAQQFACVLAYRLSNTIA